VSREALDLVWFGGWLVALAVLFVAALGAPLETRRRGVLRAAYVWGVV
jgi:hypothetical protein